MGVSTNARVTMREVRRVPSYWLIPVYEDRKVESMKPVHRRKARLRTLGYKSRDDVKEIIYASTTNEK